MISIRRLPQVRLLIATVALLAASAAGATVIISPMSAVVDVAGPGFSSIADTHNQNGLLTGFESGVTDFDVYLSGNPRHDWQFEGETGFNEWFAESDAATVTYNLGAVFTIDRMALWNEELSGIGLLDLFFSVDGVAFEPLALGLTPRDNIDPAPYPAEVFFFAATEAQFVRLDMSQCPQLESPFPTCSLGEVAFSASVDEEPTPAPAPAPLALIGLGLVLLLGHRRRRA